MTVDEHIARAQRAMERSYVPGNEHIADSLVSMATAHAAIASALLARYPGWQYTNVTPGQYEGIDVR